MDTNEMDAERAAVLDGLPAEDEPPAALEQRVVAALREQGLLRGPRRLRSLPRLAVAAAAGAALLAAGWIAGSARSSSLPVPGTALPAAAPQPTHLLLLRAGDGYRAAPTPAAVRERVAEYRAWARRESRAGRLVDGYRLAYDAEIVTAGGDVPPSTREVQGLFLVIARDLEAAVEMARGCPHVSYGGAVEVRPIDRG